MAVGRGGGVAASGGGTGGGGGTPSPSLAARPVTTDEVVNLYNSTDWDNPDQTMTVTRTVDDGPVQAWGIQGEPYPRCVLVSSGFFLFGDGQSDPVVGALPSTSMGPSSNPNTGQMVFGTAIYAPQFMFGPGQNLVLQETDDPHGPGMTLLVRNLTIDEGAPGYEATMLTADDQDAIGNYVYDNQVAPALLNWAKGFINHGADPDVPRPPWFASYEWFGSVQPNNAIDGDTWVHST